ncbi:unnamed protein product [Ectocarpus sp. 12 AP-2014]
MEITRKINVVCSMKRRRLGCTTRCEYVMTLVKQTLGWLVKWCACLMSCYIVLLKTHGEHQGLCGENRRHHLSAPRDSGVTNIFSLQLSSLQYPAAKNPTGTDLTWRPPSAASV